MNKKLSKFYIAYMKLTNLTLFTPKLHTSYSKNGSGSTPAPVWSEISDFCKIYEQLLFVSYFASQSKGMKFDIYFFDVCCVN